MSDLPRRPNDHLIEPMFAALGQRAALERAEATRTARAARVLLWFVVVLAAGATVWIALAS